MAGDAKQSGERWGDRPESSSSKLHGWFWEIDGDEEDRPERLHEDELWWGCSKGLEGETESSEELQGRRCGLRLQSFEEEKDCTRRCGQRRRHGSQSNVGRPWTCAGLGGIRCLDQHDGRTMESCGRAGEDGFEYWEVGLGVDSRALWGDAGTLEEKRPQIGIQRCFDWRMARDGERGREEGWWRSRSWRRRKRKTQSEVWGKRTSRRRSPRWPWWRGAQWAVQTWRRWRSISGEKSFGADRNGARRRSFSAWWECAGWR